MNEDRRRDLIERYKEGPRVLAILVVRFGSIGDILLTTPLLRAIRTKWPGARVTFLTKRQYVPLVSDNPNVTEVFGIAPQDTARGIAAQIRTVKYTHMLDL